MLFSNLMYYLRSILPCINKNNKINNKVKFGYQEANRPATALHCQRKVSSIYMIMPLYTHWSLVVTADQKLCKASQQSLNKDCYLWFLRIENKLFYGSQVVKVFYNISFY